MSENVARRTGAEEIAWDLTTVYAGTDDPAIDRDLDTADERAQALSKEYKRRVASLDAEEMLDLIKRYEDTTELAGRIGMWTYLNWSTNTEDPARGALRMKATERSSRLAQELVWVELEIANAPDEALGTLIEHPVLADYRHWLERIRRGKPFLLSEPEEKILTEKAVTGRNAWDRFFDELHSRNRYEWDGAQVPAEVVLNKLFDEDRSVRVRAHGSVTEGLKKMLPQSAYVFNTILADKASDDRLRGYPTWLSARNRDNEVDDESVQSLIDAVTGRYDIVNRYYRLKRRLLGLDELFDYDRYAPLPASDAFFTWDEAQETVLNAYEKFHPRMAEIAGQFFEKRWIDAPVRDGKLGGAYAMPMTPKTHPFIMMNFEGRRNDVETLAHELGHGIHQFLARERGMLLADTPLTTAETASTFGEMLVFQDLLAKEHDKRARLAMITGKLEGTFATVFRQIAMNRFEHAIHTHRREKGELNPDQFGEYWLGTQRAMFGDSVTMTPEYSFWWSYIPHFVGVPGYVYAYAFGELLVMALYARYQAASDGFADAYLMMLSRGGSDWPHAIVKPLGVDLTDPSFWNEGLGILDRMVSEAELLADEIG